MIFQNKPRSFSKILLILLYLVGVNLLLSLSCGHCRNIGQMGKNSGNRNAVSILSSSSGQNTLQSLTEDLKQARANNKETSTPEFLRLVTMRLIYGLAATMGVEDRLENIFNGAFVPPNAHDDSFGLDGLDDYANGDDDYGDASSLFRDVIEDAF